jgi:hypothetical protein
LKLLSGLMLPAVIIDRGSESLSWIEVSMDDSVPANARVWDFVVPPKSWSILPLSSEKLYIRGCIRLPVPVAALCERRYLVRSVGGHRPAATGREKRPWHPGSAIATRDEQRFASDPTCIW